MPSPFTINILHPVLPLLFAGAVGMLSSALGPALAQEGGNTLNVPFPNELTSIRIAYVKSLDPIEDDLRKKRLELKREYHDALDELGREFVEAKDQAAALAVKIEQQRLKEVSGYYPDARIEGGRRLERLRYRYEDGLAELEEQAGKRFGEQAEAYIKKLRLWEEIYIKRRDRTNAAAVVAEIQRIENAMSGKDFDWQTTDRTPQAQAQAPAAPAERPAETSAPPETQSQAQTTPGQAETEETPAAEADPEPGQLALAEDWQNSSGPDGQTVKGELNKLFGRFGRPQANIKAYPSLPIYKNITYLMPLEKAVEALGLKGAAPKIGEITTPGLPANSLKTRFYPRKFKDANDKMDFDGITVVTDQSDQVVTLQFHKDYEGFSLEYRLIHEPFEYYDYLYGQKRKSAAAGVWHKLHSRDLAGQFVEEAENLVNPNPNALRLDSLYYLENLAVQTMVRWYIPRPLVDVILLSSSQG